MISVHSIVAAVPAVLPHLSPKARYIYHAQAAADTEPIKSFEDFAKRLGQLVQAVYDGKLAGGFIDAMAALISRQITLAYREAWKEAGDDGPLPEYLTNAADDAIVNQFTFVDDYYKSIVDARVDGKPAEPLLTRVDGWANRYTENYNNGLALITAENGGNLIWEYSPEKDHCPECEGLHGIVASAKEWATLGVAPQNAPNILLTCGGWKCGCKLKPTDQRRTAKAFSLIMNIVGK